MRALLDTHAALFAWIEPERLSEPHKDPFDWLLLATARRLKFLLISRDPAFEEYPVKVIW